MERKLDNEWVYLIIQAKQMGIPIEEIRIFLRQGSSEGVPLEAKSEFDINGERV